MKRVVLLRHGQTDWNLKRLFQGQVDVPLNDVGRSQARAVRPWVESFAPQEVWCSPLSRARQTAELATGWSTDRLSIVSQLQEMNVGHWAECSLDDLRQRWTEELEVWLDDPYGTKAGCGSGESFHDLRCRLRSVLQLIEDSPLERLLIVSHGNAIRALLAQALNLPDETAWHMVLENCRASELNFYDRKVWWLYHNCPLADPGSL